MKYDSHNVNYTRDNIIYCTKDCQFLERCHHPLRNSNLHVYRITFDLSTRRKLHFRGTKGSGKSGKEKEHIATLCIQHGHYFYNTLVSCQLRKITLLISNGRNESVRHESGPMSEWRLFNLCQPRMWQLTRLPMVPSNAPCRLAWKIQLVRFIIHQPELHALPMRGNCSNEMEFLKAEELNPAGSLLTLAPVVWEFGMHTFFMTP